MSSLPNSVTEGIPCDNPPILRVKPASDAKICPLTLSVMDVASSSDLCLEKYMKLSHKVLCKDISKTKKTLCLNQKIQDDKQNDSSEAPVQSEQFNFSSEIISDCNDKFSQIDLKEMCLQTENQSTCDSGNGLNISTSLCEANIFNKMDIDNVDIFKSSVLSGASQESQQASELSFSKSLEECYKKSYVIMGHDPQFDINNLMGSNESEVSSKQPNKAQGNNLLSPKPLPDRDKNSMSDLIYDSKEVDPNTFDSIYYKTVREGWTVEESGFLTFGELYLLVRSMPFYSITTF